MTLFRHLGFPSHRTRFMNLRTILPTIVLFAMLLLAPSDSPAQEKPVPPKDAPAKMTLPEGFKATLFAGEPDVVQPIAFAFDDRGRLWVAESMSYPKWLTTGQGHDRILIFEDRDGNGRFTSRKVFADNLTNVSGLQLGF